ncbi:unnamed protein product [Phyllotreta striolata]|uniref:Uncharacterized protein n=1 Tax=Phyllotreta striolata TaxID=444603 RepID=A0A9N9U005_PHYSR|nr:unnamed protein product [Phyllotreta striolata]
MAKAETPNLVAGLANLEVSEEEYENQLSKLKKFKDQINIEGNVKIHMSIQCQKEMMCTKYSEEFDYIAGGCTDGTVRVFKYATGEPAFTLSDKEVRDETPVTSIEHRSISKLYPVTNCFTATYANGCVKCWNFLSSQCIYTIREKRQTYGIRYHPRFPKFVTYGDDLKIHLYDEETRTQERILQGSSYPDRQDGPTSRVFAAVWHPKNNYELLTGGWDDTIQFWDLRQPYGIRHIAGCHICGEGIDIHPKGHEILVCSHQTSDALQLFDYGSLRRVARLEPDIFPSKLYCGKYLSKDFIVTGGSSPNLVRIIDLQSTANVGLITSLSNGVFCIDVGPGKKQKYTREKEHTEDVQIRMKSDITVLPKFIFLSGKKLYQMDFC